MQNLRSRIVILSQWGTYTLGTFAKLPRTTADNHVTFPIEGEKKQDE